MSIDMVDEDDIALAVAACRLLWSLNGCPQVAHGTASICVADEPASIVHWQKIYAVHLQSV